MIATPKQLPEIRCFLMTGIALLFLLMSAQQAHAGTNYLTIFNTMYNKAGTPLDNCGLCHNNFVDPGSGANPGGLNPYGAAFKGNFAAIQGLQSDGDGVSNTIEIMTGFFPGWDCNNYTNAGGTLPANFANLLDPGNIGCMGNMPPIANANGSYSGTASISVIFDAAGSTDPDGTVVQYDWDFGDGTSAVNAGPLASHTYTAAGNYFVTLTITDDAGATATATTMAFIVAVPATPIANPGGPYDANAGDVLTFDGGRSFDPDGGAILSYFWNFGDGNTANVVSPNHTYNSAGTYTVTLIVVDDEGLSSARATTTASITSLIANLPPVSDPRGPYAGIAGQPVSFDGSASRDTDGNLVAFEWDFGDGNGATGASPTHAYQAAGTYTVTLTVTDDGGLTHTASVEAVVNDALRLPSCEGIRVNAVWKDFSRGHAYKYWKKKRKHHDDDDDEEGKDDDDRHGKKRAAHGKLIVTGRGQRGSRFMLSNADNPDQIVSSRRGRKGRFTFRIRGSRLNPIPCRVQVVQPDLQLCGQVDVANAPADCGKSVVAVVPADETEDDEHDRDHD